MQVSTLCDSVRVLSDYVGVLRGSPVQGDLMGQGLLDRLVGDLTGPVNLHYSPEASDAEGSLHQLNSDDALVAYQTRH